MKIRLKTYMVWRDGKYLGLKDRSQLAHLLDYNPDPPFMTPLDEFLQDRQDVYDSRRIAIYMYTWSRVIEPERQLYLGED